MRLGCNCLMWCGLQIMVTTISCMDLPHWGVIINVSFVIYSDLSGVAYQILKLSHLPLMRLGCNCLMWCGLQIMVTTISCMDLPHWGVIINVSFVIYSDLSGVAYQILKLSHLPLMRLGCNCLMWCGLQIMVTTISCMDLPHWGVIINVSFVIYSDLSGVVYQILKLSHLPLMRLGCNCLIWCGLQIMVTTACYSLNQKLIVT